MTEIDRAIARTIAAEVEDGACLQIGIGGMPNAVCSLLRDSGAKDLGIHTEMLTDSLMELYRAGVANGARKNLDRGKAVFTFGWGSQSMYDAIDGNPDMLCCGTEHTNLPHIIMQNDRVCSINSTTQMDLQGQAASESDGHRHISGTGGSFNTRVALMPRGRQVVHVPALGLREERHAQEPHRHGAHAGQHRHHAADGHHVRGD